MEILKEYNSSEIKDKNGRIYFFDNLKFVLVLLVVIGHLMELIISKSNNAKIIFLFIYSFHMPVFIFISGYFSKKAVDKRDRSKVVKFFFLYLLLRAISFVIDKFIYMKNVNIDLFKVSGIEWYLFAMGAWYMLSMLLSNFNKTYLLIFSIFLSLIIGYDKNVGDLYCLSRIITFYPFFLLGSIINEEKICKLTNNKAIKIISIVLLFTIICFYIIFINDIYFIRPILTGRNSYYKLNQDMVNYGAILRSIWYVNSIIIGIAFISVILKGKTFFSQFGSKTLAVYFYHKIIILLLKNENVMLSVHQNLIIALIITFVFSLKWFSKPFDMFNKLDLKSKSYKLKISDKRINIIIIISMIISILILIFYFLFNKII